MLSLESDKFRDLLQNSIEQWKTLLDLSQDPTWPAVTKLPDYLDSLISFSHDPRLAKEDRRIVNRVIKYIISPLDLMPEYIYGPKGYCEDCYLLALAIRQWVEKPGKEVLQSHGLNSDDLLLTQAFSFAEETLNQNIKDHLQQLLQAEAFAGDDEENEKDKLPTKEKAMEHTVVFAGPGTGKTRRLEDELYHLLATHKILPENILVTTFTNKAADELRVRVRERLLDHSKSDVIKNPEQVLHKLFIGTIHSFCYQLISRFQHHLLFLKGTFTPISEMDQLLFLFRHGYSELGLKDLYAEWKEWQQQSKSYKSGLFQFYEDVGNLYDFLSEEVIGGAVTPLKNNYLRICYEGGSGIYEKIIQTYPKYWDLLQQEGFLDYSMALAYVEALLDDPHVLTHVQQQYQYILVDEYQDTNPIQDRIFRKIAGESGRVFAVADDDQSIYAFRGADFRNALDFEQRYSIVKREVLSKHWRSTKKLLEASQSLIAHNQSHQAKNLFTENPEGQEPWRLEESLEDLPMRLAEVLLEMKKGGWIEHWHDVALLTRCMNKRVKDYIEAFKEHNVPLAVIGDKKFFKQPLVNSLIGVLILVQGDVEKITTRKHKHKLFFESAGIQDKDEMLTLLKKWNQDLHVPDEKKPKYESLLDLFYSILSETQAIKDENLLSELGRFSSILADIEAQVRSQDLVKRLDYFLGFVDATENDIEGPVPGIDDAVQLMTIHKSKGLEFPMVVILDAVSGSLPAQFPPDPRIELRCLLGGDKNCPDIMEEERRVLYVGITRAQSILLLATTKENPSPFLHEFNHVPLPKMPASSKPKNYFYCSKRSQPLLHAPHSHLYNYHFCPKRYLLENHCQFAGRVTTPLRAGLSLHRAVEILHRLLRDRERITPDRRRLIFERAWIAPGRSKQSEKEYQELFKVFENYALTWEGQKNKRVVELEYPFYVAEKPGVLTGKIDLLQEHEGNLEIVEFKFHRNPLMRKYPDMQLENYSLAFTQEKPQLLVYYLQEEKPEKIDARPQEEIRQDLVTTFERIQNKCFQAIPKNENCKICPVKYACSNAKLTRGKKK